MPKKPGKPRNNSQEESTLGPFAKAIGDLNGDKNSDKPVEAEPEEPSSGGDANAPEGESEKGVEGETPEEG